jgi:hypothetical protein
MHKQEKSKRMRERLELKLPVRIRCRETVDFEWTELTHLKDVTPFGAGFNLKRPTEKGRLLHMTMPMPRRLRAFDHAADQYRIWALVRYVKAIQAVDTKAVNFDVGAAFIGRRPPASYEKEPWKRYVISRSTSDGVVPLESRTVLTADERTDTRHRIAVDIQLETIDEKGEVLQSERTVTENISKKGASLFTTLEIPVGRFIRLTSIQSGITTCAAVRARSIGDDAVARIHVEFIEREWPL